MSSISLVVGHKPNEPECSDYAQEECHPMPADDNLRPINFGRDHPNHMVITSRNSSWIRALALQSIMLRRVRASIVLFILTCAGVLSVNLAGADESVPMNVSITEANNGSTIDVAIGATVNVFLKVPESEIYKASCLWSNITVSGAAVLQEEKKA